MAAPDAALSSVQAAVTGQSAGETRVASARGQSAGSAVSAPASPAHTSRVAPDQVLGGGESRELARIRETAQREGRGAEERASCDLDRPMYSRPPRYESSREFEAYEDVDELDAAGAEALSKLQLPDLKVSITRRTLKYVKFFTRTDRGRGMFETWLKRSGRYTEMIQAELRDRRLPEDLLWVSMIESGFDPRARSPAGAVGLWQFMPATGGVYGLQQNRHLDQRKNPRLATKAAAHHLRDLYMRFGSWDLALAAYNMGYEQLLDRIDQYGTADFNELARQRAIPSETASYVPKIAAAAIVANNIERFGFDRVEVSRPVDASEIAVPPGTPLKTLAKAAGVATSTIRTLNPDILGEKVPPGRGDYLVMIPADTFSRAIAALPAMLETEPLVADEASVLDPVNLLSGRDLSRRRAHREDESLLSLLPRYKKRGTMRSPDMEARGDDDLSGGSYDNGGGGDDDEPRPRPRRARNGRQTIMYRVGPGDTLIGVARQFAADIEDVARENDLEPDAKLKVGALLKLRVRPDIIDRGTSAPTDEKDKEKDKDSADVPSSPAPSKADRPDSKADRSDKKADKSDRKERRKKSRG
jgi:membrane-bound lytic murein transglycosylase D